MQNEVMRMVDDRAVVVLATVLVFQLGSIATTGFSYPVAETVTITVGVLALAGRFIQEVNA
jgi:hypothetical protein